MRHESIAERTPRPWSPWAREYDRTEEYVFGTEPSVFARSLLPMLRPGARVLELGSGEGRDCVFFARHGLDVTGIEMAEGGLRKSRRLADRAGVRVRWLHQSLPRLEVAGSFDLVYSCGSLHFVAGAERGALFARLRERTRPGGQHAHVVFTTRSVYREKGEVMDDFTPGELGREFAHWRVCQRREGMIPCAQDGTPHEHSVEVLIAERPYSRR
jgi:tellurite methyltransferase